LCLPLFEESQDHSTNMIEVTFPYNFVELPFSLLPYRHCSRDARRRAARLNRGACVSDRVRSRVLGYDCEASGTPSNSVRHHWNASACSYLGACSRLLLLSISLTHKIKHTHSHTHTHTIDLENEFIEREGSSSATPFRIPADVCQEP